MPNARWKKIRSITIFSNKEDAVCEINLNVSGHRMTVCRNKLKKSQLFNKKFNNLEKFWDHDNKEYFFDRHTVSFETIINYLLIGHPIIRPNEIAEEIFIEELKFFKLERKQIEEYLFVEGLLKENTNPLKDAPDKHRYRLLLWYILNNTTDKNISENELKAAIQKTGDYSNRVSYKALYYCNKIFGLITFVLIITSLVLFCVHCRKSSFFANLKTLTP